MPKNKNDYKLLYYLKTLVALALVIWIAIMARNDLKKWYFIGKPVDTRDFISVEGEGKVLAVPNVALINVGVDTENKEIPLAQNENTKKMNKIIDYLQKNNIRKGDIKTVSYNIYPQYDYLDKGRVLKGYKVSHSIQIKIRDLSIIGKILDFVAKAGANNIGNIVFKIDDPKKLIAEAREKAIKNAKNIASILAKELGVKLGKIISYNESHGGQNPPPVFIKSNVMGAPNQEFSPSVEKGSQEIKVFVNIDYEIL